MGRLFVLTAFILAMTAGAEPSAGGPHEIVLDMPLSAIPADLSATFEANQKEPELGRAWVELEHARASSTEGSDIFGVYRVNVAGLTYDGKSQRILYRRADAAPIVCAEVKEERFLWMSMKRMVLTGRCRLDVALEDRVFDTGFYRQPKTHVVVALRTDK